MDTTIRSTANIIFNIPYKTWQLFFCSRSAVDTTVRSTPKTFFAAPYKSSNYFLLSLSRGHYVTITPTAFCVVPNKINNYFCCCCRSAVDTTVRSTANSNFAAPYKNSNSISVVAQPWTPRYDQQPTAFVLDHIK